MKRLLFLATLLVGCKTAATPTSIYLELVEAGCLQATDGGPAAVAQAEEIGADLWVSCLADGGTVASCHVPCGD